MVTVLRLLPYFFLSSYALYSLLILDKNYSYFIGFSFELVCLYVIFNFLKFKWSKVFSVFEVIFLIIIISQLVFYKFSLTYFSKLALANSESSKALGLHFDMFFPLIFLFLLCIPLLFIAVEIKKRILFSTVILFIVGGYQSQKTDDIKGGIMFPALDFIQKVVSLEIDRHLNITNFELDGRNFEKQNVYGDIDSSYLNGLPVNPNVIVFFTEGFSSRWIDSYDESNRRDLTPNLDRFFKQSIVVKNYYNHTAATFRGIRGQLISGYQKADENGDGGVSVINKKDLDKIYSNKSIITLPEVLNENSYSTIFISPHISEMNLNEMLSRQGFSKVLTANDFIPEAQGPLTDFQLIDSLIDTSDKIKQPFFIATYNFGTHMLQDSVSVKYADGSSPVLNRIHEWDYNIGRFMRWFNSSKLSENTIIIFTTDHATFPGEEVISVENVTKNVFVDRIPLMIYSPRIKHSLLDAHGLNSLSFTPTLLSILGINQVKNSFLGCSVFEYKCSLPANVTAIGDFEFLTNDDGVTYKNDVKDKDLKKFNEMSDLIKDFYKISN